MGNKYKKRSRARKYTPRLQIVLSKSDYLPFFILFFTSNTSTSPDCGRFLISASFPFSRISSIAFISLSFNIHLFYQNPGKKVVSHIKQKRQVAPPPCYFLYSIKSSILQLARLHIVSIVSVVMGLPSLNRCNVPSDNNPSFLMRFVLYPASLSFCRMSL